MNSTVRFPNPVETWLPRQGETFAKFIARVPADARDSLQENCTAILGQSVPPGLDEHRTGLILGRVQSGKTMSFTGVAALARDNNFPIVIVLGGTKNVLVGQTSSRLATDLQVGSAHPLSPEWLTVEYGPAADDRELVDRLHHALSPGSDRGPTVLITLLKHRNIDRLSTVIENLDPRLREELGSRQALIIDDEADEASLNVARPNLPSTPTYAAIRRLRDALPNCTYLQYTATPQAVLLLELLDQLSPDFVHLLPPGPDYCGGDTFFSAGPSLIRRIPTSEADAVRAGVISPDPPPSLRRAILSFVVATALELWNHRQEGSDLPHNRSMLVHPEVRRATHRAIEELVRQTVTGVEECLALDGDHTELLPELEGALEDLLPTTGGTRPPMSELVSTIREILPIAVLSMNSDSDAEPRWDQQFAVIAVGGNKLQRGYTLNGLTTTWMSRSTGQAQVDTILQRGRFFGYRRDYLGYCRVYLPDDLRACFEEIVPHEAQLWKTLAEQTPPQSLQDWRRVMVLDPNLRLCRESAIRVGMMRVSYGENPEWFEQAHALSTEQAEHNSERFSSFLRTAEWEDWPNSASWTQPQKARIAQFPLVNVVNQLLSSWLVSDRDRANFSALLFQLGLGLDEHPDDQCLVVEMNYQAENRPVRTRNPNGRILQLRQGANPPTGYPGDRALRMDGLSTVQVYDFSLRPSANADIDLQRQPILTIRPAMRMVEHLVVETT